MKVPRRGLVASVLFATTALTGCARTAPVRNGGGEFLGRATLAQRADQIRAAGVALGWNMESAGPPVSDELSRV
jgi:hypothetical protein